MSNQVTIQETQIPVVEFQGQRVVTFTMIDGVHKRPTGTARRNFNENKGHFIETVDYFNLSQKQVLSMDEIRTSANPKGLTVITESGYLMLAKSFTDDLAWKVQRDLVNSYFKIKPAANEPIRLTCTKEQREPLVRAVRRIVKLASDKGREMSYEMAHSIVNLKMGVNSIDELTLEQIPQAMAIVGDMLERVVLNGEYIARHEQPVRIPMGAEGKRKIYEATATVSRYLTGISLNSVSSKIMHYACKKYGVSSLQNLTAFEVTEVVNKLSRLQDMAYHTYLERTQFDAGRLKAFVTDADMS